MMERHAEFLFLAYGAIVVLSVIGLRVYVTRQVSNVRSSYSMQRQGNRSLFRKPPALRRVQWAMFWFAMLVWCGGMTAARALQEHDPSLFYIEGVVGLGISFIFLYLAGPDDIRLDAEQRTYEHTIGWPWKPKTRFGSFSDVKGVCISPRNTVLLLLNNPDFVKSTGSIVLSSYGADQPARALVEELNRVYGFPIVPCPKK